MKPENHKDVCISTFYRVHLQYSTNSDWSMIRPADSNILLLNHFKLFPIVIQRLHSSTDKRKTVLDEHKNLTSR